MAYRRATSEPQTSRRSASWKTALLLIAGGGGGAPKLMILGKLQTLSFHNSRKHWFIGQFLRFQIEFLRQNPETVI